MYQHTIEVVTKNGLQQSFVGSVKGHPEMIATFEHRHNSPNLTYNYVDENGKTKTLQIQEIIGC